MYSSENECINVLEHNVQMHGMNSVMSQYDKLRNIMQSQKTTYSITIFVEISKTCKTKYCGIYALLQM